MEEGRDIGTWRPAARSLVLVLLLLFFAQVLSVASSTSLTVDEGLHIASGTTIWRTGDYRLIEEHPPMVKLWLALPLLPLQLPDPAALPAWEDAATPTTDSLPLLQMAQQLLYPITPFERWLLPARVMSALLGVVLLAVIARWSRDQGAGFAGPLVAVALAAFDPSLQAHAAIAGTDLGATAVIALSLWQAGRFLRKPHLRSALLTGVLLGLAISAKLTAALLGPALAVAGLARLLIAPRSEKPRVLRLGLCAIGTAALVLWTCYGLQIGRIPGIPFPIPAAAHAIPVMRLLDHSAGGHQAFLLGENSTRGWPVYFPIAFLIKTPLPALIAAIGCLAIFLLRLGSFERRQDRLVALLSGPVLFVGIYAVASVLSPLNIGYRHLLPLLPLLYTGIGRGLESGAGKPAVRIAAAALVTAQAWSALAHAPHLLPYANALAGGPSNTWRYLADSNADWGQAYPALADYQMAHTAGTVQLSAFVFYDPAVYGVDYSPLTPLGGDTPAIFPSRFAPPPGDYAISATPLDGIPLADPEMFDWFRWRRPDAQLGNALFVYHVTAEETDTRWLAQCLVPAPPLDGEAITSGFGLAPKRRLAFDCTRTWVYPTSDSGPGAYVLHGAQLNDPLAARLHKIPPPAVSPFVADRLSSSAIAYRQRQYRAEPAFAIFRQSEQPPLPTGTSPVSLDGPLTFLGTRRLDTHDGIAAETWWLLTATPTERAFSIMGHLAGADGETLGVDDGLGVSPVDLREGDLLVQLHRFDVDQTSGMGLRTGVYWLDTVERWAHRDEPSQDTVLVELPSSD